MFESAWQDVRYGARLLRRSPLFTFTAALSLAIGIGANTTIFSVASALLLRPLPGVAEPDRLVDIGRTQNGRDFDTSSYPNYRDIRARQTSLTDVYAIRLEPQPMGLGGEGGAERVHGTVVSGNYFAVLGTQPAAGRLIAPADEEGAPGSHPVMVIAHGLWQRRFGGDAAVVGQTVLLNGHPFVIAGVAPQGFQGTTVLQSEVWVPIAAMHLATPRRDASMLRSRLASWLVLGGRLKAGVTVGQADAELQLIGAALEREFPDVNHGRGLKDRLPRAGVRGRGLTGRGARIRARPALQAARPDVVAALKTGADGTAGGRLRLRSVFLVAQVALSLLLVLTGGLFLRALGRATAIDPGFDPSHVDVVMLDLSLAQYTDASGPLFARDLQARAAARPGVRSAALAADLPLDGTNMGFGAVRTPGFRRGDRETVDADWNVVSPGYFRTVGLRLVRGREFADTDAAGAPRVAIVNEALAREVWGTIDAVGRTVELNDGPGGAWESATIVGIAAEAHLKSLDEVPEPFIHVPLAQRRAPR